MPDRSQDERCAPASPIGSRLRSFKFDVSDAVLDAVPIGLLERFSAAVVAETHLCGGKVTLTQGLFSRTFQGEASQTVATLLQALAMGHDIEAVLDATAPSRDQSGHAGAHDATCAAVGQAGDLGVLGDG